MTVIVGDCVEAMQAMDAESVDAVVCDPPYALNFMGREWDRPMLGQVTSNSRPVTDEKGTHSRGYSEMQKHMRHFQEWCEAWACEALRVLKPGGHLLAFGGTRTYHRLVCGLEDAGFEIRDCITWMYGSGFPKSLNVSMAIDKAARGFPQGSADPTSPNHGRLLGGHPGAGPGNWLKPEPDDGEIYGSGLGQRFKDRPRDLTVGDIDPVTGRRVVDVIPDRWAGKGDVFARAGQDARESAYVTAPATAEAAEWEGWGTALKPASEPIVVARKPLSGTVASNVQRYGTGALNIDGARIGTTDNLNGGAYAESSVGQGDGVWRGVRKADTQAMQNAGLAGRYEQPSGRWPANVVLSHVSRDWYVLRPDAGAEAIAAYYGLEQAVRTMWGADLRDAIGVEAQTLLQQGVCWRGKAWCATEDMGESDMSMLRVSIPGDTSMGQERQAEVLLTQMPRQSEQSSQSTAGREAHAASTTEDEGSGDGQVPSRGVVTMEGRAVPRPGGLCACDGHNASADDEGSCGGDDSQQIHSGASCYSGREDDASSDARRNCSSPGRRQGEQHDGQHGSCLASSPFAEPSGDGAQTGGVGDRECRAAPRVVTLEVAGELIPPAWLRFFSFSHAEDCVQVGTQRVRTAMAVSKGDPDGHGIYGKGFPRGDGREVGYGDEEGLETVERWACVPGCPVRTLDDQGPVSGTPRSYDSQQRPTEDDGGMFGLGRRRGGGQIGDVGGPSRFFYVAKSSRAERNAGLGGFVKAVTDDGRHTSIDNPYLRGETQRANTHPTVKPIDLMRWLVRLVTPPGGRVLDPFLGSGTTGCAAVLEGFDFVGVERDPEYARIAEARIRFWREHPTGLPVEAALRAEADRSRVRDTGQMSLEMLDA